MTSPAPALVLGGDGYIGWPLALALATTDRHRAVTIVDNGARRRLVAACGGASVTPILPLEARVELARSVFGLPNLHAVALDITTEGLDALVAEARPGLVVHLAQQCSAPYSMAGLEEALYTLHNNEGGNLRVLWALRRWAPEAHLLKLGTFGEYAKAGIDVAEGYFRPTYNGRTADRDMPYPRESDDFYHASKINDSNYISIACRKWGLRVTDVMQSTIFGVDTPLTRAAPGLVTRFDACGMWGTVVNRFITQTVLGQAMTVYGSGLQRTGLMALADSVASLAQLAGQPPARGVHRVVNHVTERSWCVLEIAEAVQAVAEAQGFSARIDRGGYDPRGEDVAEKATHAVEAHYVASEVAHTPFAEALAPLFARVAAYRDGVDPACLAPRVSWAP